MNHNNYYVYLYRCPETNDIRYVGKGKNRRAYILWDRKGHIQNWLNKLKTKKLKPIIEFVESNLTEQEALTLEMFWISYYKNIGYNLCNHTNGGEGISGYKFTAKQKEHLSKVHIGQVSPMKGKKHSVSTKEKISNSHKGLTAWNKGKLNDYPFSIKVYCKETNKIYPSCSQAARDLGIKIGAVFAFFNGTTKTAKGFTLIKLEGGDTDATDKT